MYLLIAVKNYPVQDTNKNDIHDNTCECIFPELNYPIPLHTHISFKLEIVMNYVILLQMMRGTKNYHDHQEHIVQNTKHSYSFHILHISKYHC